MNGPTPNGTALLPPQRPRTGRPAEGHRAVLNGILWALRTGAPWRDLPDCSGPRRTVSNRFRRRREAGIRAQALSTPQADAAHEGTRDDILAMIDETGIRAHHHAAEANKGAPTPNAGGAAVAGEASRTR